MDGLPATVKLAFEALSDYERRFVATYCGEARMNGTYAMRLLAKKGHRLTMSGKKAKGKQVSASAAGAMSSMILRRPHVRLAVNAWMEAFAMAQAEVIWRVSDLATANVGPFVQFQKRKGKGKGNPGGEVVLKLRSEDEWLAHQHWIKEVKVNEAGVVTGLVLHDAMQALKELGRMLKITGDAPSFLALQIMFQNMTDQQILDELKKATQELTESQGDDSRFLPGQVKVVDPPKPEEGK